MSEALSALRYTIGLATGPTVEWNVVDDLGVTWAADLIGWDITPDPEGAHVPRPDDDGADPGDQWLGPRPMTLNGLVIAPDRLAAIRAKDRLVAACTAYRADAHLMVTDLDAPKIQAVRTDGKITPTWVDDRAFRASIPLVALDPYKYSAEPQVESVGLRTSERRVRRYTAGRRTYPRRYLSTGTTVPETGGEISIYNAGNARTWPIVRFHGPVTNPKVNYGSRSVGLNATLGFGEYVDLDFSTRAVTLNGTEPRRYWQQATADWFSLPPGESTLIYSALVYHPSALMTVTVYSAWL